MKNLLLVFLMVGSSVVAQDYTKHLSKKGEFYVFWGWNRSMYSNSDIHFKGDNYDFTLYNVQASDRQTPFNFNDYFNLTRFSIPQYNGRIGYFISDKYSLSFGSDHMKYVMDSVQTVRIKGYIENSGTDYDGTYNDEEIEIYPDFLEFEHTDGLNYLNIECRRHDRISMRSILSLNTVVGAGAGILVPRTNATLLDHKRHDDFHLAGYGFGFVGGLQLNIGAHFFILGQAKAGFIHMPDIRTTQYESDKACQQFYFGQANIVFGYRRNLFPE